MSDYVQQGTDAWKRSRLGRVTASRIADLMARTKTGWGASRANYAAQLIVERLTGIPQDGYSNAAMVWGADTEPAARAAYEFMRDVDVTLAGFVPHPTIKDAGASPDGYVGEAGLVEIKCPNTATHLDTLDGAPIPDKYQVQMLFQMACTGRAWCDWVSFDPRLPPEMQLFVERFPRDDRRIVEIEAAVREFLAELAERVARLEQRYLSRPNLMMAGYVYNEIAAINRPGPSEW